MRAELASAMALVLALALGAARAADDTGVVRGKVMIPPTMSQASTVLILHTSTGEDLRTFVDSDGSFKLQGVPPGVHSLQTFHMRLLFPEVRLEVNRNGMLTRASLAHNRNLLLQSPLVIRPAAEAEYYEKRKPFDVWSFVKSPYGIMIVVSVLAIVVFPRMKVDPEEFKEIQDSMRGQGGEAAPAVGQRQPANRIRDR